MGRAIVRASIMVVLPLGLAAAGCHKPSQPAGGNTAANAVDINAAARAAQGDIDTYAANALQTPTEAAASPPLPAPLPSPTPSPTPSAAVTPPAPGTPGGLPDDGSPVSEAPFAPGSAQAAANIVQTYFALIEGGKYRQAWALWGEGGKASGMSAAAFAASFAKYAAYHAQVGAPGRVDAGAGQRYVSVPVVVYGRLTSGEPVHMTGDLTLHRTGDIDGATAAQKLWHITAANLKPRPETGAATPPAGEPATAEAQYRCADGSRFHIVFDNAAGTGTVSVAGKRLVVLDRQPSGSGIRYSGGGYTLRGKGNEADFTRPGEAATSCTAK